MKAYRNLFRSLVCCNIFVLSFSLVSVAEASPEIQLESLNNMWSVELAQRSFRANDTAHQLARNLLLNESSMRDSLNNGIVISRRAFNKSTSNESFQTLPLPLSDGSTINVQIEADQILPKELSIKFPEIKTYRVIPDDVVVNGRVDITQLGFHAMIQMRNGDTFFIDPKNNSVKQRNTSSRSYVSYRKQDQEQDADSRFSCGAHQDTKLSFSEQTNTLDKMEISSHSANKSQSLLTYKIAVGATGEYTAKYGGTVGAALSAIVTTLNRVNQVFEQDLGIHLSLIENNDLLIYTNAQSDPYNASGLMGLVYQNQENIDSIIGTHNYDVGHLFTTRGGGLAAVASVCNNSRKAMGISGTSNPKNDSFNLDFVAHEIAHQLGANHTFNGVNGSCAGGNRNAKTAFEPGSGSTIMSYAGHCGADNIQSHTDAMLHIGSINEIRSFTVNGKGNTCGARKAAENTPPVVEAGLNYTIPANTPFELKGAASDLDEDRMVYAWEQVDAGDRSHAGSDTGNNALFRTYIPNTSTTRSFPPIRNIVNHFAIDGEKLTVKQRSLTFNFVAQDSYNAAQSDDMTVSVMRTGSRFALYMPHAGYSRGDTHQIFWNTANTNQAPVNCESVDVSLSVDGGHNYDKPLASGIPNIGKTWITIPADTYLSQYSRFKIKCSNNIFFAISYRDFKITEQGSSILPVLSDADQPEAKLKDWVKEDDIVVVQTSSPAVVSASGGSFDWYILILGTLVFVRRLRTINGL